MVDPQPEVVENGFRRMVIPVIDWPDQVGLDKCATEQILIIQKGASYSFQGSERVYR
jgi:hypothetical protein